MSFLAFVGSVLGVALSPGQRVLCAVAFDGADPCELAGDDRELARSLFGDVERVPALARAVLVAVCGARGGKSYVLGALYSLWRALVADLSTLAPGETATALIVAPDVRLGRVVLRYALGAARACAAIAPLVADVTKDSFVLVRPDGHRVTIEVLPASRGGSSLRGRTLVSAVLDECAFFRDDTTGSVNDADLFAAVAPRVLPGGLVVLASTPWTQAGLLFDLFGQHGAPVTCLACTAPTLLLWPSERNREAVERERQRDPDNAAREFFASFMLAGAGQWFDRESLQAAIDPALTVATSAGGAAVAVGWDLALQRDASAAVVLHRRPGPAGSGSGDVWHLAEAIEVRPRKGHALSLESVVHEFGELAKRHGATSARLDHHLLSEARRHAGALALLPVPGGAQGKLSAYITARDAFRRGKLRIPASLAWIAEQLAEIVSVPLPGGGVALRSPRRAGTHGDTASALVAAVWSAMGGAVAELAAGAVIPSDRGSTWADPLGHGGAPYGYGTPDGYQLQPGGPAYAIDRYGSARGGRARTAW